MWVALLVSLLVVAASTALYWLVRRKWKLGLFQRHGIPGPEPDLFWGNFMQLKQDRIQVMERWIAQHGKVFGFYMGEAPFMVVSDPEMVKQCLVKEFQAFHDRPPFAMTVEPFASCLLELRGDEWKRVRSVLNPTFSSVKIKQMSPIVRGCLDTTMQVLEERCRSGLPVDMLKVAQGYTLDVITKCAFAWQVDCQMNPNDPLLLGVRKIFEEAEHPAVQNAIRFPVLRYLFTALYWLSDYYRVTQQLVSNLSQLIELRRRDRRTRATDMLQIMLEAQEGEDAAAAAQSPGAKDIRLIEDRHVVSNAFIFMVAGFETTATSLAFIMYLLATHPEEQERLYSEIGDAFESAEEELSYQRVHQLKRLDMFIQEALRIYPPVVLFVTRKCEKDTTVMGQFFPKGVTIMAPTWHLHHDPALWSDPFVLRPERFDPEGAGDGSQQHHPGAYLPFGLGPRICIGKRFALLELKLAVCRILQQYRVVRCPQTQEPVRLIVQSVIINPMGGVVVSLERRPTKAANSTIPGTNSA